jgi:multidrug efflux system membrane fusion protein
MAIRPSFVIAGLLALGLAGWLVSGQIDRDESGHVGQVASDNATETTDMPLPAVRVRDLAAELIERDVVANGKTAPERRVQLRAETNGRIIEIGGREGGAVDDGALLIGIDRRDRDVAVLEMQALLRQRQLELEAARKLGEKGFQAETAVAKAEADFATAEAALKRAELELDHTTIEAPFAGILDRRHVEIGDFVDIGDPVATLLDQDPLLVVGEVSETEVGKLKTGMPGTVRLATGERLEATVRYIATQADEQTRTFEIELQVPNPDYRLAAGISAEISVTTETVPAHQVSPSVLVLNDDGRLGVKTVGDNDTVLFMPVDIARADNDHVWLTGLPPTIRLITVGQGFVGDGAKVQPVAVGEDNGRSEPGQVVSEAVR